MKSLALKIFDWVVFIIALIIVLLAVLLSLTRLFLPHMTKYQPLFQQWASHTLHQPVHIGQVTAAWRGLEPEFKFQKVAILNTAGTHTLLEVKDLGVSIDLFKSLLKWQIVPGWVVVSGANISLHQDANGKITLNGIKAHTENGATSNILFQEFGDWLLAQNRIYLERINVTWNGKDGRVILFKHLKLRLVNNFLSHSLMGSGEIIQFPQPTIFHFALNLNGDIFKTKKFKAKLSLDAKRIALDLWLNNHIPNLTFTKGIGNVQLSANWTQGQLQELKTNFIAENFGIKSKYLIQDLLGNYAAGEFLWQRKAQGWNLSATNSRLDLNGSEFPQTQFTINATTAQNSKPGTQIFQVDALDLDDVKNLLLLTTFPTEHERNLLNEINPFGTLKNFTLTHTNPLSISSEWRPADFSFTTSFDNVSWSRWQKLPGVTNLSGSVQATPTNGALTLDAKQTKWDFGNLFRTIIPVDDLHANMQWQKNINGWQIQGNNISANNSLMSTATNFSLLLPSDNSSPIINVLTGFNFVKPEQAIQYLPVGIMANGLVNWLDHAIVTGKDGSGKLLLTGPLKLFPFIHQEGRFLVDTQLNDLTLNYRDGWPPLQHLNAELIFDDNSMTINGSSANIFAAQISNLQGIIPSLNKPILQITGDVKGDLNDSWQFLQQSPLYNTIGKRLTGFVMRGPMALNLRLQIPLQKGNTKVQGNLTAAQGDLKLPEWWNLHVSNLTTALQFTEKSLSGNLQGQLFNQPLNVKISTLNPTPKTSITQLDLGTGQMTLAELEQRFNLPKLSHLDGTLNYHAVLKFSDDVNAMNALVLDSNLQGIAVDLPPPLAKTVNENVPSQIQLNFNAGKKLELLLNYGKRASAALTFMKNSLGNFYLFGGELTFGGKPAVFQTQPGLVIDGYLPSFSWKDWQPLLTSGTGVQQRRPPALLRSVDMTFGQFNALGLSLSKVEIQLQPDRAAWKVGIHSANIDGQFTVPYNFPRGTLIGNFTRLYLGEDVTSAKTAILPKDVPAFNLTCQDFRYGNKSFGTVNLKVTPTRKSLNIDQLNVTGRGLNLVATGRWTGDTTNTQQTAIDGKLTTDDLGTFLTNWNITKNLVAGNGSADFSLQWPTAPYQFSTKNINGDLSLRFYNGRIINLSSSTETELGLGRVLNLLSLQTLPRRLRFDFSDITDSGYSFDVMKGDFSLQQGNANTDNAYIDGPLAKIQIKGRIGLSSQDYNLRMIVTPYVTSNIPAVVATVAGGPIVGAVTWVATKVFSTAVKELVTYTYEVTGSWNNPNIVRLTAAERLQLERDAQLDNAANPVALKN